MSKKRLGSYKTICAEIDAVVYDALDAHCDNSGISKTRFIETAIKHELELICRSSAYVKNESKGVYLDVPYSPF
jgi:dTDP-D-glucose 4,6-dehydratase